MSEDISRKLNKQHFLKKCPSKFRPLKTNQRKNPKQHENTENKENKDKPEMNQTFLNIFNKIYIIIIIIFGAIIILSIFFIIFLLKKNNKKNTNEFYSSNFYEKKKRILKPIFTFNNKVRDLKRINVIQTSYETKITNGKSTKFLVHRNTTYDIYIKSEQKSEEKNKTFYSIKYIAVMNIVKECFSTKGENCEPKNYMDLSTTQNKNNLSHLPEITDLKNIPIPICFIEFTDNNIIISISCPESLSENKKYEMKLDFYSFRPFTIEKPITNNSLKNITIENIPIRNGIFIRKKDSGICDTKHRYKTYCTKDMNVTADLNNNLLTYDEIFFSNFTKE